MQIQLATIFDILVKEQLLKEFVTPTSWQLHVPETLKTYSLSQLSYDSRHADAQTLFFCKGLHFKTAYLEQAVKQGVEIYVAETPYEVPAALGIIVTDVKKALAVLSMAFYHYPQEKLKIVAFTGTKGKTTAAYFAYSILSQTTKQKTALLSTMNTTLDGQTFFKSQLTTPESLDLYRMMAQAVDNGMTHLVMEVSSQAYKTERVYGLTFDVGIFLNISPDHISPIEHETFDDYFYCKRQLIAHAKTLVLNQASDYFTLLEETAQLYQVPVITYGQQKTPEAMYTFQLHPTQSEQFSVHATQDTLAVSGAYHVQLGGTFNKENALSAILASALVGATRQDCQEGIAQTTVPGRMEQLVTEAGTKIYIDYAHNYVSLHHLLTHIKSEHPTGKLIVVLGSPGEKAISRRKDFGEVLSLFADKVILTTDDPAKEDPKAIAAQIQAHIHSDVSVQTILDRTQAIQAAIAMSHAEDAVVLAGKGADPFQKINGEDIPYEGDFFIAKRFIQETTTKPSD